MLLRQSACILNLMITTEAAHISIIKMKAMLSFITNEKRQKIALTCAGNTDCGPFAIVFNCSIQQAAFAPSAQINPEPPFFLPRIDVW